MELPRAGLSRILPVYKTSGFSTPCPGSSLLLSGPSLSPGSQIPPALCPFSAILLLFPLSSSLPCCIPLVEILHYFQSLAKVSFFNRKDSYSPLIVILFLCLFLLYPFSTAQSESLLLVSPRGSGPGNCQ